MIYLVDKSAWEQLRYSEAARVRMNEIAITNDVAICPAIVGELLFAARDYDQLDAHRRQLADLHWLESTADAQERMLFVMQDLARRGQHRGIAIIDLLIAATAEAHWATVLHYDSDFERIAEITGQPHEWIVPRGEGHSR